MSALKALILASRRADDELSLLAGGKAPHTLPVANVPLLLYGVEAARLCGATDIGVVVSADTERDIRELLADRLPPDIEVEVIPCENSPTFAATLMSARDFLAGSPFLFHLGDSLVTASLEHHAETFASTGADALLILRPSGEDAGAGELDRRQILRLVDGRPTPPSEHLLSGAHFLGPEIVETAAGLLDGPPGRQTLAATLSAHVDRGRDFQTVSEPGCWKYSGDADDLLDANRMVLDELPGDLGGADLSKARVDGRVIVHPSAVLDRVTVRGPAIIGPGTVLVDTFVGPYTSIGRDVRLEGAEIEYSVVLDGAVVRHPGKRLEASVLGQDARIEREFALPASIRLRVGRGAEVRLG